MSVDHLEQPLQHGQPLIGAVGGHAATAEHAAGSARRARDEWRLLAGDGADLGADELQEPSLPSRQFEERVAIGAMELAELREVRESLALSLV